MLKEFKNFIARGNVVDLAVAVIIGAAFGKIVNSLVEGIIMPPIGLVMGKVDFSALFIVLDRAKGIPASLADAKAKGIPIIAYGAFLNDVVNFLIVAFAALFLVRQAHRFTLHAAAVPPEPTEKQCPRCLSVIPIKATRCAHCAVDLPAS